MTAQSDLDAALAANNERVMRALYPDVSTVVSDDGSASGAALFTPLPEHVGAPGWVQGGLSATVLDFVCARLASAAIEMKVATGTLDLRYRQPVLLDGGPYKVEGSTDRPRSRTVRVRSAILSAEGRPLIEANGLFIGVSAL
jgi:acyl-coenzyme A thioesterase PaaI-like protein